MNLTSLYVCIFMLVVGINATLNCYQCSGKEANCPRTPTTQAQLKKLHKIECDGVLSTVCAKYSVDLFNGESYTYRSCEPTYIGGISSTNTDFCAFVNSLYDPLVSAGLLAETNCKVCNDDDCNL